MPNARLVALGSRKQQSANAFGHRFSIPRSYGSYAALLEDPEAEVVYVCTPRSEHYSNALDAIRAGESVLCEKPLTLNRAQAVKLVDAARQSGVFLMEAMWTRFLPHMTRIRQILQSETLGDIRLFIADHGHAFPHNPKHRIYAPALGGGAMLDLGIY